LAWKLTVPDSVTAPPLAGSLKALLVKTTVRAVVSTATPVIGLPLLLLKATHSAAPGVASTTLTLSGCLSPWRK